jgi:NodT family efflux transporter outer membrane factor (OMF) lipoprotein
MVGPDYKEPVIQVAEHWPQKDATVEESPELESKWWEVFNDPVLTTLIQQGYQNNITLEVAGVRVLQARAQLAQAVGELYPQQQALIGNYAYNRVGGGSLQGLVPESFDTSLLGFSLNWEMDFWGKYRRAIQSNDATFLASLAAYDNALVTLTSDIASTYIKIRTLETQIKVTEENIKVQKIGLDIATSRFNAGETSLVDVEQAQTELAQTESTLPSLVNKRQHEKDTLSVLLGTVPGGVDEILESGKKHIPKAPNTIAVGVPMETLLRRPDIYQARLEAIAQSASIGAIKANLYPSISLSGTFAVSANSIGNNSTTDLFSLQNRIITAGPGFNWPILNYGQITNAVRVQDAVFQQALLNYTNLILRAQQEVQDNISGYVEAKNSDHFLNIANDAATKTLKLTMIRYKEGETDFTPVLYAEQQQLSVQMSLASADGEIPLALVALYRALGGGWQIRENNDVISMQLKDEMAMRTNWGGLLRQSNHEDPTTTWQEIKQLYLPAW